MILKSFVTSCLLFFCLGANASEPCPYYKLLKAKYYDQAIKCAISKKDRVHQELFQWLKYKKDDGSFEEISTFLLSYPNVPNFGELAKNAEDKIDNSSNTHKIQRWLLKHSPRTPNGLKYYVKVMLSNKTTFNKSEINTLKRAFIRANFTHSERESFYQRYKKYISNADIMDRVVYTIWHGDRKIEKHFLTKLNNDRQLLLKAIVRILNNERNIQAIHNSVPKSLQKNPDLLYSQALWYKRKGYDQKLASLLLSNLGLVDRNDDRWFKMRVSAAVDLMEKEDYKNAYKIIGSHKYNDPVNYVDAEWLAGRIAYIYLKNPRQGFTHFKNIVDKSQYSISITKGSYWAGLAARDINMPALAKSYFIKAAIYPDTYYGQLSLMKLGYASAYKVTEAPKVTPEDLNWFQNNVFIKIAYSLFQYKKYNYARRFVSAAVSQAHTIGQKYLVTEFGREAQIYMMSVVSGKENARRGLLFIENSYPVVKVMPNIKEFNVEVSLILSIIRQESEFNQYARSHAGAMGLMQLIYSTAKDVSRDLKSRFTRSSLYRDKHLNMKFGTYHLSKLLEYYDGSYILSIAAYNAGQGNVDKWIKRFGDPRKLKTTDQVVTWIEKIPFYETRGYVQHVLSNLQMYRNIMRSKKKVSLLNINLSRDLLKKKR